jgi:hypothetical protein
MEIHEAVFYFIFMSGWNAIVIATIEAYPTHLRYEYSNLKYYYHHHRYYQNYHQNHNHHHHHHYHHHNHNQYCYYYYY